MPLHLSQGLIAALGQDDELKEIIWKINETLRELSGVNRLCQKSQEDRADLPPPEGVGFPNFVQTTEAMGALYGGDINMLEAVKFQTGGGGHGYHLNLV